MVVRLLLHLAGSHPVLPSAELDATLAGSGFAWRQLHQQGRLLDVEVDHPQGETPVALLGALDRLALTREAATHLFSCARDAESLMNAARTHPLDAGTDDAPLRFMVRAEYAEPAARQAEAGPASDPAASPGRSETERLLGHAWSAHGQVDLDDPQEVLRAWITRDEVWVGRRIWDNDTSAYQGRAPKHRPYFSPVSGHPNLMRAVVNLARVPRGALVYDPLVGTGGILLEAGLAGLRIVGSDNDPTMVQGTRENLHRYNVEPAALFLADVREAEQRFLLATGRAHADAVVTDLPYGQSSTTGGAQPVEVAHWTLMAASRLLPPGRRLVIGTSTPQWLEGSHALGLIEEARFDVPIHKSLTRSYHVMRRIIA